MPAAAPSSPVLAPGQLELFGVVFEGQGTLSGSLGTGGIGVAGATFVGTRTSPLDAPPATGQFVSVANDPGFFAGAPLGTGAPLVGTMPVRGSYRLTGFGGSVIIELPFAVPAGTGAVTAGLGVGGTVMAIESGITMTATFGPWSSGNVTIADVATPSGTGTIMATGGFMPGTPDRLQLVTPVRVVSSLGDSTGSFATLTYELPVPEPALPALLAVGSIVLAAAAVRKAR